MLLTAMAYSAEFRRIAVTLLIIAWPKQTVCEQIISPHHLQEASKLAGAQIGALCSSHLLRYVQEFNNGTPWALKMFDGSAKVDSGVLLGGLSFLGFYSECIDALPMTGQSQAPQVSDVPFSSQYCLLNVQLSDDASPPLSPQPLPEFLWNKIRDKTLSFGICVPSTCTEDDIDVLGSRLLQGVAAGKNTTHTQCSPSKEPYVSNLTLVLVTFFLVSYIMLVAGATAYDIRKRCLISREPSFVYDLDRPGTSKMQLEKKLLPDLTKDEHGNRILLSFSLVTNAEKLFTVGIPRKDSLSVIHGIRTLSMNLIILGHTLLYAEEKLAFRNRDDIARMAANNAAAQFVYSLVFVVDTFFVLTGLLVVYLTLNRLEESKGKMNWAIFYLHRYWRLTPLIAIVSLFWAVYMPYCGDGPLWQDAIIVVRACQSQWWVNLVYLQNFLLETERCLGHTWYVAVDFQYYLISPLIIYALYRKPRLGFGIIGVLFILSTVYTAAYIGLKELPLYPHTAQDPSKVLDFGLNVYLMPHCRIGPYLIGMICGYILHTRRGLIIIKKPYVCAGWAACTLLTIALVLAVWPADAQNRQPEPYMAALYGGLSRSLWAVCVAWILISCLEGYGGPVNALLSSKTLVPFSRLTFAAYVVHTMPIYLFIDTRQQSLDFSRTFLLYIYPANVAFAYLFGIVMCLLFEAPIFSLEKLVLAGWM